MTLAVEVGATQADTIWQLVTDGAIVVGVTALTFKDITDGLARLLSPIFVGSPKAPTPAQFDSSKLLATAEFVKRSGVEFSGFTSNSADSALTAAHVGGLHSFSGAGQLTATLPPSASIAQGATVTLACAGAGGLRVVGAGTDVVYTSTGVTGPILMALGDTAEFIRLQDQWRLIGGTIALRYAGIMAGESFTTRPQFDSSKALATTEFVQRAAGSLAGYAAYTANTVLTAADVGKYVYANAPAIAITLPDASLLPAGSRIYIQAAAQSTCTVKSTNGNLSGPNGSSTLSPNLVLGNGTASEFIANGVGWLSVGGTGIASAAVNGYQRLPSGVIFQWGQAIAMPNDGNDAVGTGADTYITFPIAFPNACASVVTTHHGAQANLASIIRNISTTRFTAETASVQGQTIKFFAVGY
jgi:hypothetical protein